MPIVTSPGGLVMWIDRSRLPQERTSRNHGSGLRSHRCARTAFSISLGGSGEPLIIAPASCAGFFAGRSSDVAPGRASCAGLGGFAARSICAGTIGARKRAARHERQVGQNFLRLRRLEMPIVRGVIALQKLPGEGLLALPPPSRACPPPPAGRRLRRLRGRGR